MRFEYGQEVKAHDKRYPSDLKTFFRRPDTLADPLYVVTTVFNAQRYRSRWKTYESFKHHVAQAGAILYIVEIAFGDREFVVTNPDNPCHLQIRTTYEYWFKEQAQLLGVQRLPADWKYVMLADADVKWARPDWADETRHLLQHYPILQPWSEAYDLSPDHTLLQKHLSLAYCYRQGYKVPPLAEDGYYYYGQPKKGMVLFHPGYCWAYTRQAFNAIGGQIDFAALGSADFHMAHSYFGNIEQTINSRLHPRYKAMLRMWGNRAYKAIKRNVGFMPGTLLHEWHGSKPNRRYKSRWSILIEERYNPDTDIYRDSQGLFQLSEEAERQWRLRDKIREYFALRDEDSTHVG